MWWTYAGTGDTKTFVPAKFLLVEFCGGPIEPVIPEKVGS